METRSEADDCEEPPWVFETEPDGDAIEPAAPILGIKGPDIFVRITADRPSRRLLPASLTRRGRHNADELKLARSRASHPCQGSKAIYLVDDDDDETARIELRRSFEGTHGDHLTGDHLSLVEGSAAS